MITGDRRIGIPAYARGRKIRGSYKTEDLMDSLICLIAAILVFAVFLAVMLRKHGQMIRRRAKAGNSVLKPVNYLMIGTFLSCFLLFIPVYEDFFASGAGLRALILSIHNSIRLFVIDADFEAIREYIAALEQPYGIVYEVFFSILYVLAPILTFGFLLSLFNNLSAYCRFFLKIRKDLYVFSDLNERSLALAEDIVRKNPGVVIIFTDISTDKDVDNDLIEKANLIGAILFKKSIASVNYNLHSKNKKLVFFLISPDENENISQSSDLIGRYGGVKNSELYLFSSSKKSELFLDNIHAAHVMKIRRVREARSLINRYLYDNGSLIFRSASVGEGDLKTVSAVVIGMGTYGTEMAKALPWFCQLPGYRFRLNVFDKDANAESKFTALCPEYMSPACNKVYVEGEAQYDITFHSGVDYRYADFEGKLSAIRDASFVFIALGSDEENINCAIVCRTYFERKGIHPKIVAVVYDSELISGGGKECQNAGSGEKPGRRQSLDIDCFGSLKEQYSANVIINSKLEEMALQIHMRYYDPKSGKTPEKHEADFWMNEYNYDSSCSSAIHNKVRVECKISGADKNEQDLTDEERAVITVTEHRRWNAYLRSCGYVYSGSKERSSRNDLAKMHNCLVPFDELTEAYQKVDSDIAINC